MERIDLPVLKKILVYHMYRRHRKRDSLRKYALSLRLVSKQWKKAIEAEPLIWGMVFKMPVTSERSQHLYMPKTCTGAKKRKDGTMRLCAYACHMSHLKEQRVPWATFYKKRMKRKRTLFESQLEDARRTVQRVEKELKFIV